MPHFFSFCTTNTSIPRLISKCMLLPREPAIYLPREQSVFGMNCMVQWKSSLQVNTLLLLALEVETNNPLDALKLLLKTQCTSHCLMATISYTDFPGDPSICTPLPLCPQIRGSASSAGAPAYLLLTPPLLTQALPHPKFPRFWSENVAISGFSYRFIFLLPLS